jgi:Leucine-rich repeat (LRR) protein
LEFDEWDNFPLDCLAKLPRLQVLVLMNHIADVDLSFVENVTDLRSLTVTSDQMSENGLRSIGTLRSLEHLSIDNEGFLSFSNAAMAHLSALRCLRHLTLVACDAKDLRAIAHITTLEEFYIAANDGPLDLEPLANLPRLTKLTVRACVVTSLLGLNRIRRLDELEVTDCEGLTHKGLSDLLPCRLSSLVLSADARDLLENSWDGFVQSLRTSNLWIEIGVQEATPSLW